MAVALAREGSLPIGRTVAESEKLQAQTAAAELLSSPLDFSDIADVRSFIEDAQSGNVCQLEDLCQVRKTLAAVRRLHSQVFDPSSHGVKDGKGMKHHGLFDSFVFASELLFVVMMGVT